MNEILAGVNRDLTSAMKGLRDAVAAAGAVEALLLTQMLKAASDLRADLERLESARVADMAR